MCHNIHRSFQLEPGAFPVEVIACDGEYVETRLMNSGPKTNPWMQDSVSIFAWGVAWIQSMKNQSVLHSCIH